MVFWRVVFSVWLTIAVSFSALAGDQREPEHARSEVTNKVYQTDNAPSLRVVTFNMAAGRVGSLAELAKAMVALDADIIGIQEVDNQTLRSGGVDQAKELASLTGFNVEFAKAIDFEGGEYGLAIASRHPIVATDLLPLASGQEEGRVVQMAKVSVPEFEHPVTVFNTHLDTSEDPQLRLQQTRQLNKWTMNQRGIKLLLGDFNDVRQSATYKELKRYWKDTWNNKSNERTWPASNPEIKVDYVFTSPAQQWKVVKASLPAEDVRLKQIRWPEVTDHLPVVVDMILLEQ
ncbi:endonuclease [Endozoicomonas montiporae]|uniref:Endonuclease n=2 Tax=Endozoicomonas montiporae TaxID=1027273 RepID=A0A081N9Q5_9GAMM|nr:endonuclease/exonuclease/phosphatase family protein [Endozoicomonas montiporae]AMO55032.1 endonuclease/exonuclease/phosphatase [Endozoicomonas montiporae CL-33]KEQ15178.1 endonuclease [Endozoicomonas montiporae]